MIRDRWKCSLSGHGMYRLDNQDGTKQFVANGEGDSLDEPITFISSSGIQEGVPEYCGFDGYMDPENPEEPPKRTEKKWMRNTIPRSKDSITG